MTPTLLQTVFRRVARLASEPTADSGSDEELLRKFVATQDETAFQTLVDRHGPLAWAVCRQMLTDPADAEDAFQATFLALVQSAKKLGRVKSVGGWLHGVAVRVCLKVRRSAARRKQREERAAKPEAMSGAEPEWDSLHAAVHEEIHRLPAVLRTVFVLCELEGVRQPDAAVRLGCKLGTVSGRLARARQALLKALAARGLAPVIAVGAVAVGGTATALAPALVEKALTVMRSGLGAGLDAGPSAGLAVPSGVVQLAKSVSEGAFMKTKLMVAATLLATGLMLAAGGMSSADAQGQPPASDPPPRTVPPPRNVDPDELPARQPRNVDPARPAEPARQPDPRGRGEPADPARPARPAEPREPREPRDPRDARDPVPTPRAPEDRVPMTRGPQQRMEHELFDVPTNKDELAKLIKKQESTGWEFAGQVDMGKGTQLVFKRPKGVPPMGWGVPSVPGVPPAPQPPRGVPMVPSVNPPARGEPAPVPTPGPNPRRGGADTIPPRGEPTPAPIPQPRRGGGGEGLLPFADETLPPPRLDDNLVVAPTTVPVSGPVRPKAEDTEIYVIELKNASPMNISSHIKTFFEVQVNVDEDSGSLVIRCGPKTLDEIKKLVEKLDKPSKRNMGA